MAEPATIIGSTMTSFAYWKMIFILGGINFLDAMVYSIPAPFYPAEAESKGLTTTEYGLVFGSFEFTSFVVCPIIGNYMYKTNPRLVYHLGVIVAGTSVTLFGFLDRIDTHSAFLILSFILRILESVGSGLLFVSSYSIVTNRAPECAATTFATMELLFGLGFSTGPIVGEALFVMGGFKTPFFVLGGSLLVIGLLTYFCFEMSSNDDNANIIFDGSTRTNKKGFVDLLELPPIMLQAFAIVTGALSISFLYAVLEPHLRQFHLQPMTVGIMFFISGVTYAFCSVIYGKICDAVDEPSYFQLLGSAIIFIGMLCVGPASFLPIAPSLQLVTIGLIIIGVGLPAIYVSAFTNALTEAKENLFENDPNALVSGLWISCMSLGSCLGPSISGFLTDHFGFRKATNFVLGLNLILMSFIILNIIFKKRRLRSSREHDERSALLMPRL